MRFHRNGNCQNIVIRDRVVEPNHASRNARLWVRRLSSVGVAIVAASAGCGTADPEPTESMESQSPVALAGEPEQPLNVVYSQTVVGGIPASASATAVTPAVFREDSSAFSKPDVVFAAPVAMRSKIAAPLQKRLDELERSGRTEETVSVLVSFDEDLKLPRFPHLDPRLPRNAPENAAVMQAANQLADQVIRARGPEYDATEADLLANHRARSRERFWILNALQVDLPASEVAGLADRSDVVSVDPVEGGGLTAPMSESRAVISSDPYFNSNLTTGFIGVLDSGVITNANHTLLSGRVDFRLDCVNGGTTCNTAPSPPAIFSPWDTLNHGTSVLGIIGGTNNLGNNFRGVSAIHMDSLKVTADSGAINFTAVGRAYQRAAAIGDTVTNASFHTGTDENSFAALAADGAFNAGLVVIAAAGNSGPASMTADAPATARHVLAVGAIDAHTSFVNGTRTVLGFSSRGPALDGRIKPDLIAPTNVDTGNNTSSTATSTFGGTSGAAPHVTGAAAMWIDWVKLSFPSPEPGQIYANLIAMGGAPSAGFDNTQGAGALTMLTNGAWFAGKTSITNSATIDLPFTLSSTVSSIDAAIWWPESSGGTHNDVDLSLVNPSGAVVASSVSVASIFEKVRTSTNLIGTWKVRIRGFRVTGTQIVYWSALQHL
jgi:serine protease AprX